MESFTLGLYGKVPAHGDFIDRDLPVEFIRSWDDWLQQGVSNSRERLGDEWLNLYLTSPIWRFMLSAGTIDEQVWAGVLVPSVDSVGRYFPLTIATCLPARTALATYCLQNDKWFRDVESAAYAALEDGLSADQISEQLLDVAKPQISAVQGFGSDNIVVATDDFRAALALHLDAQVDKNYDSSSLWFSAFAEPPTQQLLLAQGLPTADQYTAMIDSSWQQWGWDVAGNSLA
mgnify:CR=1 FL=1